MTRPVCEECGEVHYEGIMLRFNCAALFTKGCLGFLIVEAPCDMVLPTLPITQGSKLDAFVRDDMDERIEAHLLQNDWRRVGGKWICPRHPVEDFKWWP